MGSVDTASDVAKAEGDARLTWQDVDASVIASAKQHLEEHGWAVIPNVLTADQTAMVRERLWTASKKFRESGDDTFMPFLDPNESNVRVFYLMALDSIFRDLVQHPVAVEMVEAVLGTNWLISNFTANIARPGSKSMALHSDQSLVMPDPWLATWALNVIWCLDDVYRENGSTLYIPGSDKWKRRTDIPQDAKKLLKPFEASAGSIVLMNGRVWHTSGSNVTPDKDRSMLFGYYTVPFLRQQVNWAAKMGDLAKDGTLSPELVERLGMNVGANLTQTDLLKYLDDMFPDEEAKEKPTY